MSDKRRDKLQELIEDTGALLALAFAVAVLVWAFASGNLTPEVAADLLDIAGQAISELTDSGPGLVG